MIKLLLLMGLSLSAWSQSPMDSYRWYLNPQGEKVLISIDDLHDETLTAVPEMNWGRGIVPEIKLKKEVVIAVIDGGLEIDHPELRDHIAYNAQECFDGKIIPPKDGEDKDLNGYKGDCAGWDFVEESNRQEDQDGHGTHVSGVINSVMSGTKGYKFLPLKVFAPNEGKQSVKASAPLFTRLTRAFEYAISRKVDIIHLSVGWPKSYMSYELEQAIKKALNLGIIVVAAAGNSSQRATIYPCQMEGVICVGALRPNGEVARFSNWGSQVDLFAPGEKILSTIPHTLPPLHISRKGYDFKNGTSQAAPFITGALALLRGSFPELRREFLTAKLLKSAKPSERGMGLRGLFQLDRALEEKEGVFLYPALKGLHSVVLEDGEFSVDLSVQNLGEIDSPSSEIEFTCEEALISNPLQRPGTVLSLEKKTLSFSGALKKKTNLLNCELKIDGASQSVKLKVQHKLKRPVEATLVHQDELLVVNTRTGARSRFTTLNAIKGTVPGPYYYITGDKSLALYHADKRIGSLTMPTGCAFLRVWQIDYDHDQKNEFMVEGLCDKTHLLYQFLSDDLKPLYPEVRYKPTLSIVNYDDFEVLPRAGLPPTFRFINSGFMVPSDSPWDSDSASKANHLYELVPVADGSGFKFEVSVLEDPSKWQKSLGLRYLPNYEVLHYFPGKLLVKIGTKTAWIDLKDQSARWASLDHVLLMGSRKQDIVGQNEFVLQSFLTPYEYRGFVLNGVKLRFVQEDKFDPFMDILGTEVNDYGYKTVLRSFQKLIYLQYDFSGNLVSIKTSVVDRFDFLTAQDLIASVANLIYRGKSIQVVDGTKVNTNYVDVVLDGELTSYEIPSNCATHNPVVHRYGAVLPIFCAKNKTEFEMRFIPLAE